MNTSKRSQVGVPIIYCRNIYPRDIYPTHKERKPYVYHYRTKEH